MSADPLTFAELRAVNVARCDSEAFGAGYTLESRSPTDWGCALAGEVGEACNLLYKMRKGVAVPIESVAKELADAQTYLDLLAARLGIDLGAAVRSKFNEVSDRVGSSIRLAAPPTEARLETDSLERFFGPSLEELKGKRGGTPG